jgi:hypothetical protein
MVAVLEEPAGRRPLSPAARWGIAAGVLVGVIIGAAIGVGVGVGVGLRQQGQVRIGCAARSAQRGFGRWWLGQQTHTRSWAAARPSPPYTSATPPESQGIPDAEQMYLDGDDFEPPSAAGRQLKAWAVRSRPSIVCVGDGLTESGFSFKLSGWGSQLVGAYLRKVRHARRYFWGSWTHALKAAAALAGLWLVVAGSGWQWLAVAAPT